MLHLFFTLFASEQKLVREVSMLWDSLLFVKEETV